MRRIYCRDGRGITVAIDVERGLLLEKDYVFRFYLDLRILWNRIVLLECSIFFDKPDFGVFLL